MCFNQNHRDFQVTQDTKIKPFNSKMLFDWELWVSSSDGKNFSLVLNSTCCSMVELHSEYYLALERQTIIFFRGTLWKGQ